MSKNEDLIDLLGLQEFDTAEIKMLTWEDFEEFDVSDIQFFNLEDVKALDADDIKPFYLDLTDNS